jgi:hypothetical protein
MRLVTTKKRKNNFIFWLIIVISSLFIIQRLLNYIYTIIRVPLWDRTLDFEKLQYSNVTGHPLGYYLVPNYIHFIHIGGYQLRYTEMICVLAALKNQKPEKIFFHYNKRTTFSGKYWEVLEKTPGFKEVFVRHDIRLPTRIFGLRLDEATLDWHGSDIARIRILKRYGGIYLGNDCYLVRSIDYFRKFEISLSWEEDVSVGTQTIIAHKDARFLESWLQSYKHYKISRWHDVADRPTKSVISKQPHLVHRVNQLFGTDIILNQYLFAQEWSGWKDYYILYLWIGHLFYLRKSINEKAVFPVEFNETNIGYYPITFRDMAYDVYDIANITWPKTKDPDSLLSNEKKPKNTN